MSEEHDTSWTDLPTCPHCGDVDRDWWDGLDSDDECVDVECGNCERWYRMTIHKVITFSTKKLESEEVKG